MESRFLIQFFLARIDWEERIGVLGVKRERENGIVLDLLQTCPWPCFEYLKKTLISH